MGVLTARPSGQPGFTLSCICAPWTTGAKTGHELSQIFPLYIPTGVTYGKPYVRGQSLLLCLKNSRPTLRVTRKLRDVPCTNSLVAERETEKERKRERTKTPAAEASQPGRGRLITSSSREKRAVLCPFTWKCVIV